jgi:hypothetical protein
MLWYFAELLRLFEQSDLPLALMTELNVNWNPLQALLIAPVNVTMGRAVPPTHDR